MVHRHGCNYHFSPEFSLLFPMGPWVGVRGWFYGGYISQLLGYHPQGEPGTVPSSQRIPGQHFLIGVHSSMRCHRRDRWSHEPRRNTAAWDGGRRQLHSENQGDPGLTSGTGRSREREPRQQVSLGCPHSWITGCPSKCHTESQKLKQSQRCL